MGISIHALREEGDGQHQGQRLRMDHFYPRPPRGGRHPRIGQRLRLCLISIHALREEGDQRPRGLCYRVYISIHALREEGDACWAAARVPALISIHALREEGDARLMSYRVSPRRFLSTPSARRATCHHRSLSQNSCISIHALREEGDGLFT